MGKEVKRCACGEPAAYFHTRCCNAHVEGEIINGDFYVVCEKCGKMVGKLIPMGREDVQSEKV